MLFTGRAMHANSQCCQPCVVGRVARTALQQKGRAGAAFFAK
jgi:hypothetical protein